MAKDSAKYPWDQVYSAADLASNLDPAAVPSLLKLMNDPDSAIRFWAVLGLHMRGESAVKQNKAVLNKALADDSNDVRIVAAQALGMYGDSADLGPALETLGKLAPPETNGVLTSMAALAAVEALGEKASPLREMIAAMKPNGPSPDGRFDSYVPRLMANISPSVKPAAGKGKKPKKNKSSAQ
ncbi:MAG: HEAT repeat domain-containing protein [Verrucomicrobia bacterium]|nr:HEAT repeat domain-containing protein [Verrucomicrobiota bacterium]